MSSRKSSVLESPQTTIGAQDMICIGNYSKSGFLRKQGLFERLFQFLRWRQTFVILSRGCIYIFKDEWASRPKSSYTLRLFLRTIRNDNSSMRWSFSVLPVDQSRGKTLLFACISDQERKEWMKSLKAEMMKAHNVTEQLTNENRDEYIYLEKPVEVLEESTVQSNEENPDDLGGEKDYDTIEDAMIDDEPAMPKPDIKKKADIKKKPKPNPKPKPPVSATSPKVAVKKKSATLPASNAVLRSAFEYKGTDRDEIESVLTLRPEGTYLVRKSRQDGKEVLSVNIDGVLKEFKIYSKDSTVTIDHAEYFSNVEELIQYYSEHPLPKKSTKLYRAYSVVDPRYVN